MITLKHLLNKLLGILPGTRQSRVKRAASKSINKFQKTLDLLDKYDKGEIPKKSSKYKGVARS